MRAKVKVWPMCVAMALLFFSLLFVIFTAVKESRGYTNVNTNDMAVVKGDIGDTRKAGSYDTEVFELAADLIAEKKYVSQDEVSAYALLKPFLARNDESSVQALQQIGQIIDAADAYVESGAWKVGLEILTSMQNSGNEKIDFLVAKKLKKVNGKYREKARFHMRKGIGTTSVDFFEKALRADPTDAVARDLLKRARAITGSLDIFCVPARNVYVDSVDMRCLAPVSGIKLLAGKHKLELTSVDERQAENLHVEFEIRHDKRTRVICKNGQLRVINDD